MGQGNESLFIGFESNDQDICHAHIWLSFENFLLGT